jgi:hypothetical protein
MSINAPRLLRAIATRLRARCLDCRRAENPIGPIPEAEALDDAIELDRIALLMDEAGYIELPKPRPKHKKKPGS